MSDSIGHCLAELHEAVDMGALGAAQRSGNRHVYNALMDLERACQVAARAKQHLCKMLALEKEHADARRSL